MHEDEEEDDLSLASSARRRCCTCVLNQTFGAFKSKRHAGKISKCLSNPTQIGVSRNNFSSLIENSIDPSTQAAFGSMVSGAEEVL